MKRVWMILATGSLLAGAAMAETLSGTISDAACGAKHAAAAQADMSCVERCIKRGEAPVFVSEGKVYKIAADSRDKVSTHLGQKVTINGTVAGDTVTIASVSDTK
jgi:hypothetical protein